ncbi:hypothetical protein, partial [Acinetobacter junii]|uniref:hypothetical protein n=1 Tax=Acinetobacter junii TaxID=40215 RepID=UPI001C06D41F
KLIDPKKWVKLSTWFSQSYNRNTRNYFLYSSLKLKVSYMYFNWAELDKTKGHCRPCVCSEFNLLTSQF